MFLTLRYVCFPKLLCFIYKGIWEYVEQTRDMVHVLEKSVQSAKTNVETMNALMAKWSLSALYDRKDGKKDTLLNIEVTYQISIFLFKNYIYYQTLLLLIL